MGAGEDSVQCKMLAKSSATQSKTICDNLVLLVRAFHVAVIHAKSFSMLHSMECAIGRQCYGLNDRPLFLCHTCFFFRVSANCLGCFHRVFGAPTGQENIKRTRLTDDEPNESNDSKQQTLDVSQATKKERNSMEIERTRHVRQKKREKKGKNRFQTTEKRFELSAMADIDDEMKRNSYETNRIKENGQIGQV